ncbi:MAG: hypothetical protein S4CHLAM81_08110 [Chlamydiales bacterium]|nr:hypothetical protein [Chlamydiales bacterium]MCH9635593.1 hypothetical protein [Chlamydiales bacterium]MCH9703314.1 hypothetical protein [Chlamydiota bacterium]
MGCCFNLLDSLSDCSFRFCNEERIPLPVASCLPGIVVAIAFGVLGQMGVIHISAAAGLSSHKAAILTYTPAAVLGVLVLGASIVTSTTARNYD